MIHSPKNKQILNTCIKQNKIRLQGDPFKWLHELYNINLTTIFIFYHTIMYLVKVKFILLFTIFNTEFL